MQEQVLFNIILFFELRGRENLRHLKRDTFGVSTTSDGTQFISIVTSLLCKNVKASISAKDFNDLKNAKMFASEENCPVKLFVKYCQFCLKKQDNTLFPAICKGNKVSEMKVLGKCKLVV